MQATQRRQQLYGSWLSNMFQLQRLDACANVADTRLEVALVQVAEWQAFYL